MSDPLAAGSATEWRAWLAAHADSETEVWLVIPHKNAGVPGTSYDEAVRQALCFGWIDSHHLQARPAQLAAPVLPAPARSSWSDLNRRRAAELVAAGQMTDRGLAVLP